MRLTTAPLLPAGPARVETVPGWIDPIGALALVRGRRNPALLYSGLAGRHAEARHSILAWDPVAGIAVRGGDIDVTPGPPGAEPRRWAAADPFAALRELLPRPAAPAGLPFAGGAIGYLGYGLRSAVERLARGRPDPLDLPDAWFAVYDAALLFDHATRTMRSVRLPGREDPSRAESLRRIADAAAGAA
ncbi:MAG TPA: hypothetical protein VFQ07_08100, partial [Candidatus Polarisedimenticolia bacterium]|nr:hypothetical protein [Candidatus Polarisedimenticolia bacterium]